MANTTKLISELRREVGYLRTESVKYLRNNNSEMIENRERMDDTEDAICDLSETVETGDSNLEDATCELSTTLEESIASLEDAICELSEMLGTTEGEES